MIWTYLSINVIQISKSRQLVFINFLLATFVGFCSDMNFSILLSTWAGSGIYVIVSIRTLLRAAPTDSVGLDLVKLWPMDGLHY